MTHVLRNIDWFCCFTNWMLSLRIASNATSFLFACCSLLAMLLPLFRRSIKDKQKVKIKKWRQVECDWILVRIGVKRIWLNYVSLVLGERDSIGDWLWDLCWSQIFEWCRVGLYTVHTALHRAERYRNLPHFMGHSRVHKVELVSPQWSSWSMLFMATS